jgi:hypothetical protein
MPDIEARRVVREGQEGRFAETLGALVTTLGSFVNDFVWSFYDFVWSCYDPGVIRE